MEYDLALQAIAKSERTYLLRYKHQEAQNPKKNNSKTTFSDLLHKAMTAKR
jgi:hypothetical protein